ncbi:MAG: hypothetical protein AB8B79_22060, partial [Granulosicoccus sp.]
IGIVWLLRFIRARVNRFNRQIWCTTKLTERLGDQNDICIDVWFDRLKLLSLLMKNTATVG